MLAYRFRAVMYVDWFDTAGIQAKLKQTFSSRANPGLKIIKLYLITPKLDLSSNSSQ